MVSECEKIIKVTIPSIKIAVARMLARNNVRQERIAAGLGISQAAVSKYIKGKYSRTIKSIVAQIDGSPEIEALARSVASGKSPAHISRGIDRFASKRIRFAASSLN